jgi:methyl-accepting chemotaxis protein
MSQLNPESKFSLSIKEIIASVVGLASIFGIYFTMQSSLANAQDSIDKLEQNAVNKLEFTFKDDLIRSNIENTNEKVEGLEKSVDEIKQQLNKIDERLYQISKNR